jgi:hypothetical protein
VAVMNAVVTPIEADLSAVDAPTCEQCGCIIEDLEEIIFVRAADLVARWELADPRDAWRHTGEQPPRSDVEPIPQAKPYRTPQATIDAFWYVVGLCDPARLTAWLDRHPQDKPFLLKLLEGQ